MRSKRAFLFLFLFCTGCAHTETEVREVHRVRFLETVSPAEIDLGNASFKIRPELATDQEIASIRAEVQKHLATFIREHGMGKLQLVECALSGSAEPKATYYRSRCRLRLQKNGARLIETEARAIRTEPAKSVSRDEGKRIRKMKRNPLLSLESARKVMRDALNAAAEQLFSPRLAAAPEKRKAALAALDADRLGAVLGGILDLAAVGESQDGARVIQFLKHRDARVRRAAAATMTTLARPVDLAELNQAREVESDESVRKELEEAIAIALALSPSPQPSD